MFKRPDILSRISLFPERPAMSKSVTALSTCARWRSPKRAAKREARIP